MEGFETVPLTYRPCGGKKRIKNTAKTQTSQRHKTFCTTPAKPMAETVKDTIASPTY